MRAVLRALLLLEVLVCFGPMTLMLMMGALLVPVQVFALFDEPLLWEGPVQVIGSVLCGAAGLGTLIVLLSKLFEASETDGIKRPWLVFGGALIGAIPLIDPLTSPIVAWRILGAMPIVAGVHVLILTRRFLVAPARKP